MLSLLELAKSLQAQCTSKPSGDVSIARVSSVRAADPQALVFAESDSALREALASDAGAILTTSQIAASVPSSTKPLLIVAAPRLAFARAARIVCVDKPPAGVHPTAIVPSSVQISRNVSIGAYAVIGESVRIGERSEIGPGCVLADGVTVGGDCHLYPGTVIYKNVRLGNRVIVHAGCVLGSDGFGYVRDNAAGDYTQFPQQGALVVEDDVEIGANTTIDRGALEETRIERGTKLDNLVHIGHNVRIGRNVVIAAQTGISGSSTVGEGAVLGGQVGMGDHAHVGPGVILGGGAGVLNKKILRGSGMVFWGRPAQPLREYLKSLATLARLTRKAKE